MKKNAQFIPMDTRQTISSRYHTITKAINNEFWGLDSDTQNSFYVGSYGRGTAINTSDLDVLVILPEQEYTRCNSLKGNVQSRLLQTVKSAIINSYPRTDVRADGQIVKIHFTDEIKFEILPAFKTTNVSGYDTYKYPDTNMGGNWCSTNPKAEQDAMDIKNKDSNGLLFDTCKHIRFIRDNYFSSYHLSGIVIDSFAYHAIGNWHWLSDGNAPTFYKEDYEKILLKYLNDNTNGLGNFTLTAPGSNENINTDNSLQCLKKVLECMVNQDEY